MINLEKSEKFTDCQFDDIFDCKFCSIKSHNSATDFSLKKKSSEKEIPKCFSIYVKR